MDSDKLAEVLKKHAAWLRGDTGGERADLYGANLSFADLSFANLSGANLSGADLRSADLPRSKHGCMCRMDFGGWSICIYHDRTTIGCQAHRNELWLEWTPDSHEIKAMHSDAADWWQVHGDAVKAVIRCVMAKAAKYENETVKES